MEKNGQISRRYTQNSGDTQDERTVKWRAVDGKLLLDLCKKAVYASYTYLPAIIFSIDGSPLYVKILFVLPEFRHSLRLAQHQLDTPLLDCAMF